MHLEKIVERDHAIRFALMAVSSLLFVGVNAVWNALGYLNPIAWFLEWSSIILAFLCVYSAVSNTANKRMIYSYFLIVLSIVISGISYYISILSPTVHANIYKTINPNDFFILAIPLGILPLIILQDLRKLKNNRILPFLFFISVLGSIGFLIFEFYLVSPAFPTDESVFDMYAAHLFLSGLNPYNPALMSNAFSFYSFQFQAFSPITPLTTGGYVQSLTYPALSFLIFIPAVLLHLKASLIMLPVLLAPIIIVCYRAWSRKGLLIASYSLLPFLGLLLYVYQGGTADTDVLWTSFLMLSYIMLPRGKTSGILFGLSLSVKQLPFLIAPFLLYYVYMEYGTRKTIIWALSAVTTFFMINGYFIIQNPGYWFSSMLANEFAPLIGIGFGIPQISFVGIVQVSRVYFTIIMVDLFAVFLALYIVKYRQMKYALFAFPILIFLFSYRLFPQYLYFWMIASLVPMIEFIRLPRDVEKRSFIREVLPKGNVLVSKTSISTFLIIAIILGSVGLGYHVTTHNPTYKLELKSVTISGFNSTGYIDKMNVIILFQSATDTTPIEVHFRIFSDGPIINGNMFMWNTINEVKLYSGHTYNLTIIPNYSNYTINPHGGFIITAYCNQVQSSYYVASTI